MPPVVEDLPHQVTRRRAQDLTRNDLTHCGAASGDSFERIGSLGADLGTRVGSPWTYASDLARWCVRSSLDAWREDGRSLEINEHS
jgi:hypothetical protein